MCVKNQGNNLAPTFVAKTGADNPFNGFTMGSGNSVPACVDIDLDGDIDCFFGESGGTIVYYKNTGTRTAPTFTLQTAANNPLSAETAASGDTTPFFFDIDQGR